MTGDTRKGRNVTGSKLAIALLLFAAVLSTSVFAGEAASAPRNGKYLIMSYGAAGSPPLHLGYFVLAGGKYTAYLPGDKRSGNGDWQYDAANQKVVWKNGPYAGVWDGKFEIARGGKTHNIKLKRGTFGTNSID